MKQRYMLVAFLVPYSEKIQDFNADFVLKNAKIEWASRVMDDVLSDPRRMEQQGKIMAIALHRGYIEHVKDK